MALVQRPRCILCITTLPDCSLSAESSVQRPGVRRFACWRLHTPGVLVCRLGHDRAMRVRTVVLDHMRALAACILVCDMHALWCMTYRCGGGGADRLPVQSVPALLRTQLARTAAAVQALACLPGCLRLHDVACCNSMCSNLGTNQAWLTLFVCVESV